MKLTTHKDIDIHVSDYDGEFSAEVHGVRKNSKSLDGIKSQIDAATKITYKRTPAILVSSMNANAVELTSVTERGQFRYSGGQVSSDQGPYHRNDEVEAEIKRLNREYESASAALRNYIQEAKSSKLIKVKPEEMTG